MGRHRIKPLRWALGFLALCAPVAAQPDPAAEPLPLAAKSLLLDVTLAGDRVVAVGERGHILLSDDYGLTWTQATVPTRATLTAVTFISPEVGWAAGHDNVILHTRDGGATWQRQPAPAGLDTHLLDIEFLDPRHGFAVGAYGIFFETRDGGSKWELREILEEEMHINRLSRGPDGRLYMALEWGVLMASGDDGETWEELDSPYDGSLFGILPLTARTLLTYGLRGHVFRSSDSGETWDTADTEAPVLLTHALRLASGPVVLAGQNEQFLISHDGGQRFSVWRVPVLGASALAETPDGALIAVGLNGAWRLSPPIAPRPTPAG